MSWRKYISKEQFPEMTLPDRMQFQERASKLFILFTRAQLNQFQEENYQKDEDKDKSRLQNVLRRIDLYNLIDYNGKDAELLILNYNRGDKYQKNYPMEYAKIKYAIARTQVENSPNPVFKLGVLKKRNMWIYGDSKSCQMWLQAQNAQTTIMNRHSFDHPCKIKKTIVLNQFNGWMSFSELMMLTDGKKYQYFVVPSDCIVVVLAKARPENIFNNFNAEKLDSRFSIEELKA